MMTDQTLKDYVPREDRPDPRTSLLSEVERTWALHAEAADHLIDQLRAEVEHLRETCRKWNEIDLRKPEPYICGFPGCDGSSEAGLPHSHACNRKAREEGQTHAL